MLRAGRPHCSSFRKNGRRRQNQRSSQRHCGWHCWILLLPRWVGTDQLHSTLLRHQGVPTTGDRGVINALFFNLHILCCVSFWFYLPSLPCLLWCTKIQSQSLSSSVWHWSVHGEDTANDSNALHKSRSIRHWSALRSYHCNSTFE